MNSKILKLLILTGIIVLGFKLLPLKQKQQLTKKLNQTISKTESLPLIDTNAIRSKAEQALKFCKQKQLNQNICILIDMSIHSGLKRFFVWSFEKDSLLNSFLVSHGCGESAWGQDFTKENVVFSNAFESHSTSKGRYKIGERGVSSWGVKTKYLMHGLDSSNSNASKRFIVFHSWEAVSNEEVYPSGTAEGWGCPAISNENFKTIDQIIQKEEKALLMWIY